LEEWENKLQTYKEKTQSVSVEDRQNIVVQRLKELSLRVTEAKSTRIRLESEYAQVQKLGTNAQALLVISAVANDLSVKQIQASITKLEAEFANLKQRYKEKHPKYMQAASELANWQNSLREAILAVPKVILASLESVRASEQALERTLHEQESFALELSKQQIQYNVIAREVESHRTLYEAVMSRRNETALTKKLPSEDNKIRVVQPAVVPQRPFKPEPAKLMTRGLLAGLVAGILLALGLNALDSSFKTVDQTEEFLAMPVLSVVPQIRDLKPESRTLVVSEDAKSAGAEAFRSLRTALSMLGRAENRRTFLFSSALPQEGKTFCSLNYAASLAQQGLRTVLIDGDLRRPAVEPALTGNSQRGLGVTDYLTGQKKFQEIIQQTSLENFSFISAGTTAPNPAELLAQRGIDALIEEALSHYDRVLVDSAPIHAVSDTLLMVNRIQTVCLVVRAYKTPRKAVLRAIQLLQKSRAPIAGIILNRVPRKRGLEYYYDPYYDYAYHGKYAQKGVYGA
jgi:capsular exopolysaccharide synthesis family protein